MFGCPDAASDEAVVINHIVAGEGAGSPKEFRSLLQMKPQQ